MWAAPTTLCAVAATSSYCCSTSTRTRKSSMGQAGVTGELSSMGRRVEAAERLGGSLKHSPAIPSRCGALGTA